MEQHYYLRIRYLMLALIGLTFVTISHLIHVYKPMNILTESLMQFTPNSVVFDLWKEPPTELFAKIYIFNVSNPEEFLSGQEKLQLKEVGPYTYREFLYNVNATFYENGTMSFLPKRKLQFMLNNSIGDASTDRFILPNIALLGMGSYLHGHSMFTNLAFSSLASYLDLRPFNNLTVDEYLFGFDDPVIKLVNNILPNWIDFSRLGIFDRIMALDNSSELVTMNVKSQRDKSILTGEDDIQTYGIERWASSPGLSVWGYTDDSAQNSRCNSLEGGFLGTMFPQNMPTNETIRLFRRSFCRSIPFNFQKKSLTKEGFDMNVFEADPKFLSPAEENSENDCYCPNLARTDDCPLSGVSNLSPCYYGMPVTMSFPHFLNADPSISEKIDGMFPNKSRHKISIGIHPRLGIPLEVHMGVQLNLMIPETRYNSRTRPFNNLILPLLWADLSVEDVPSGIQFYIRLFCNTLPLIEQILMFVFGICGLILVCYSTLLGVLAIKKNTRPYYSALILSNSLRKPKMEGVSS